jgi:hypothetical protein
MWRPSRRQRDLACKGWRDARASAAQHVLSKNHTFRKKRPIWSGACYMYTVTHNYNF